MSTLTRLRTAATIAVTTTLLGAVAVSTVPAAASPATPRPAVADTVTAVTHGQHVLFKDFFSTSPDPAWTFYNRAGEVRDGRLWIDGDYLPSSEARNGWALTHVGDTTWTDYSMSVAYDTGVGGGEPPDAPSAMFFVRTQAQAPGAQAGTTYRIIVFDVGAGNPTTRCGPIGQPLAHGSVQIDRIVNGILTAVIVRCASGSVTGANLALITADGPAITVRVNGVQVLRWVDPHPLLSGGVGVGAIWETNGAFDNVRVWER